MSKAKRSGGDRGEYRPIFTVLVHGADYQQLSPSEKLLLLHCKLNLGAAGIGVLYIAALAEQTGISEESVRLALATLEHRDWLRVERNVIWVVNGLKYEPSLTRDNDNHRKWLRRHLDGLPNLAVVNAFRARYADWLGEGPGMVSETPSDGIPKPLPITTTNTTTNTKPSAANAAAKVKKPKYPHFPREWCDRLLASWSALGLPPYAEFRNTFGPVFPEQPSFTVEQVEGAITAAIEDAKASGTTQYLTPRSFVARLQYWVDFSTPIAKRDPARARTLGIIA
jgi:hypothetical protein